MMINKLPYKSHTIITHEEFKHSWIRFFFDPSLKQIINDIAIEEKGIYKSVDYGRDTTVGFQNAWKMVFNTHWNNIQYKDYRIYTLEKFDAHVHDQYLVTKNPIGFSKPVAEAEGLYKFGVSDIILRDVDHNPRLTIPRMALHWQFAIFSFILNIFMLHVKMNEDYVMIEFDYDFITHPSEMKPLAHELFVFADERLITSSQDRMILDSELYKRQEQFESVRDKLKRTFRA